MKPDLALVHDAVSIADGFHLGQDEVAVLIGDRPDATS
jgi:hypothetical protein